MKLLCLEHIAKFTMENLDTLTYGMHMSNNLWHEYVKQLIKDGAINIIYVKSSNNLADPLTKGFSRDLIKITYSEMRLKSFIENHQ